MAECVTVKGDCLEVMPTLPKADVVVTSPPYNLGLNYKTYEDSLPEHEFLEWMGRVSEGIFDLLKDGGSLFLNVGFCSTEPWRAIDIANVFRRRFVLQNQIVWVKSISLSDGNRGHFKPVQGKRFVNNMFEHVFHFSKTGDVQLDRLAIGVAQEGADNADRFGKDVRCRGNVWFIPYETIGSQERIAPSEGSAIETHWLTVKEAADRAGVSMPVITMAANAGRIKTNGKRGRERGIELDDLDRWSSERAKPKNFGHCAIFPVALPEMCIKLHGVRPETHVVDPFVGSGTTLVAAKRLGVFGTGIDIDADYLSEAEERLQKVV